MSRDVRRYLVELLLGLLIIGIVISGLIGIRYESYQREIGRMALILESDDMEQDLFRILKGDEKISKNEADDILSHYGYVRPKGSEAGRRFLSDCASILAGGTILWLSFAVILGIEEYKKRKEREKQSLVISEELDKIRAGEYGQIISEMDVYMENQSLKRIFDALDSLGSYVDMIRTQAHREKEETKTLVTDLSHQLKTPVAALTSCFHILKNPDLSEKERMEFQCRMEQQLHSLEQLIGALVNISRMETGMIQLRPEKSRIFDTILEAVNRIWIKAQQKEIEIQMEAEDNIEVLRISHDRKWLCEALVNILDNAVKYSPPGTMITLRTIQMTAFLRIEIQDQGIGIPRENYHKVFQRFYRGKQPEVQKEEGAGVGLYLARKIIEGHHGIISLDTRRMKKEKGTIFVIQLPKNETRKSLTVL